MYQTNIMGELLETFLPILMYIRIVIDTFGRLGIKNGRMLKEDEQAKRNIQLPLCGYGRYKGSS